MNCELVRERLLEGLGSEEETEELVPEVAAHVRVCRACADEFRFLRAVREALRPGPEIRASDRLVARILGGAERILDEEAERQWSELTALERLRATGAYVFDRARRSRIAAAAAALLVVQAVLAAVLWSSRGGLDEGGPAPHAGGAETAHAPAPHGGVEPARLPDSRSAQRAPRPAAGPVEPPGAPLELPAVADGPVEIGRGEGTSVAPVGEIRRLGLENRRQRIRYRMRGRFAPPEDTPVSRAVHRAHRFLASLQRPDGGVDPTPVGGEPEGTTAATALAVLAWMTDARAGRPGGTYARAVESSIRYLRRQVGPDRQVGWVRGDDDLEVFQHAVATAALVEHAVLTDRLSDPVVADVLERLVDLARTRDPAAAGEPDVTGAWVAFALALGRASGIDVPFDLEGPAERARRSLLVAGGADRPGLGSLLVRECDAAIDGLRGIERATSRSDPGGLLAYLERPELREPSLVLFTTLDLHERGGRVFERWRQRLEEILLAAQEEDGSWRLDYVWSDVGAALGDAYPTSVLAMALAVPRRWSR